MVIPATILLFFFWSWLLGYTINRISMVALIFSTGILVGDAIVRSSSRWCSGRRSRSCFKSAKRALDLGELLVA